MGSGFGIGPWAEEDRGGVIALISGIQRGEFGFAITPEDQPDLTDVAGFYRRGAGEFWVARDAGSREVVGTIALVDMGNGQGALRKMFVRADRRGPGSGVSSALLATLLQHAGARGLRGIFLGTTSRFLAAHRFYEKHGFTRVEKSALPPAFPVMAVDTVFYRLDVSTAPVIT